MKSVKVPLKKLNDVRKELMEKKLMRMDYRIKAKADYGYIPIKEDSEGYEIVDIELKELNTHPHNFSELLEDELTDEEINALKTSFDTIGDIVNSILDGVNRSNVDYFSLNGTTLMIAEGTPAGDYKVVVEATAAHTAGGAAMPQKDAEMPQRGMATAKDVVGVDTKRTNRTQQLD